MNRVLYLIWMSLHLFFVMEVSAQCPTVFDLQVDGQKETTLCAPGQVTLSVNGIQMPSNGVIKWMYSEDENFDPRTQGTLITTTQLPNLQQQSCPTVCPDLLMIMMNSCDGTGSEPDNEFFIFTSGSGFYASDLQFKINEGTNDNTPADKSINIGNSPCQIQEPTADLMNRLRQGACSNLNLFPAGPGDFIPADAIVIFYMSSNVTMDYDITTLCESGHNVYVMQNACQRTMGAFTNSTTTNDSYRYNFLGIENCAKCIDSLNYNRKNIQNKEGEYIIDNNDPFASVENGSILVNTDGNPCQTPDLSNYMKAQDPYSIVFNVGDGSPLCGKKIYFKAYVTPSDETICQNVVASGAALNILCSGSSLSVSQYTEKVCSESPINIQMGVAGDYTWTVSAPDGVTGLSSGSGSGIQTISQTPVYSGDVPQKVTYTISLTNTSCPIDPITISVAVGAKLNAEISGNTQICSGASTTLTVNAGVGETINWSTGAQTATIQVNRAGTYTVTLDNGICTSSASVTVLVADDLHPVIMGNAVICEGDSTSLSLNTTFDFYTWSNGSTSDHIVVNQPGQYSVEVRQGDCTGNASFEVTSIANLEVRADITPESCAGNNGAAILELNSNSQYDSVLWSSGETTLAIHNKTAGTYNYVIYFGLCSIDGSVVIPHEDVQIQADVNVVPTSCNGAANGSISISNVINGTEPYTILLNGNTVVNNKVENLLPGTYFLSIRDAHGCSLEKNIVVDQGESIEVNLPGDTSVVQWQEVIIIPAIIGNNSEPERNIYSWSPSAGLSCTDCFSPSATPTETTEYYLSVENAYGCKDFDTIIINVIPERVVYLPKAFSPNGDGTNDILCILSNIPDAKVKRFEIYNRWGEQVFKVENVSVNDYSQGWDGNYKNKKVPLDTYSYFYEVEFLDGTTVKNKGVVLVIR